MITAADEPPAPSPTRSQPPTQAAIHQSTGTSSYGPGTNSTVIETNSDSETVTDPSRLFALISGPIRMDSMVTTCVTGEPRAAPEALLRTTENERLPCEPDRFMMGIAMV